MTDHPHDLPSDPPAGFEPLATRCDLENHIGPLFVRTEGDTGLIGFRVQQRHLNRAGMCHGGFLATLADMNVTPVLRSRGTSLLSPTVSMSLDYIAAAKLGTWVQARSAILRQTRRLLFSECHITADDELVVRANVIYRITPAEEKDVKSVA